MGIQADQQAPKVILQVFAQLRLSRKSILKLVSEPPHEIIDVSRRRKLLAKVVEQSRGPFGRSCGRARFYKAGLQELGHGPEGRIRKVQHLANHRPGTPVLFIPSDAVNALNVVRRSHPATLG